MAGAVEEGGQRDQKPSQKGPECGGPFKPCQQL